MAEIEQPQIYLISPPELELARFPGELAACLDAVPVACFRLAMSSTDEGRVARAADACREICHGRDVAIVIERHVQLAQRLGLDGVHLTDGARTVRKVRKDLGGEAIVGCFCGQSRHDGMMAGEADADYVSFGPVAPTALGDGAFADTGLFQWWSEMIEVPVIAEGALSASTMAALAPYADFFGVSEIWSHDDPEGALRTLFAAIS